MQNCDAVDDGSTSGGNYINDGQNSTDTGEALDLDVAGGDEE